MTQPADVQDFNDVIDRICDPEERKFPSIDRNNQRVEQLLQDHHRLRDLLAFITGRRQLYDRSPDAAMREALMELSRLRRQAHPAHTQEEPDVD